ncbi:MAG: endonuclease Q family protein [Alicyclobacillus herbarius]|uniref:endonuclease Q family protein n=1 Tax=Alicyclobacillus herbarius TaxID=122960 RepID=UPI000406181B|nr:endonuclease Q family protein [Alicyclobacillus herbarius]MCL6631249.1 endonuclease Q family protein [Alicyclobacillus herbarius]
MSTFYADFHVHIGRAQGQPVKMAAAATLTLANLLQHASEKKGIHIVCVIDGVCPPVQVEVRELMERGELVPMRGGGLSYQGKLTVILGAEVEIAGPYGGAAHFGCWFGDLSAAADFSAWLATVQKNPGLSSQRARTTAVELQRQVRERDGLFIIHHAFTPHKGMYGNCVRHMADMVNPEWVDAVELGLSADTDMADCLEELSGFTFLSNSDAHSLPKIAREYNRLELADASFEQVRQALRRSGQARVTGNYGLTPALGKYHRSACKRCGNPWEPGQTRCACGSDKVVMGVYDRLVVIRDMDKPVHPSHRPPYVHQVPLEFVPGLGPKTRARLLDAFGSEMAVLHQATESDLEEVVGAELARRIEDARSGRMAVTAGRGGVYGKLRVE